MAAQADIRLQRLEEAHAPAAAAVLDTAFSTSDYAWGVPLGMTPGRFHGWMEHLYLPERARSAAPASFVALSGDGAVLGVCANEDFNVHEPDDANAQEEQGMREIDAILGDCKAFFWRGLEERGVTDVSQTETGVVAYIGFLAVSAEARRRRVGHQLVARSVEELRAAGTWRYAVAVCTSHRSRDLFASCGFQKWGGVSYQSWGAEKFGKAPFASLPVDECVTMVLKL